jgi:hypothetical protein
MNKPILVWHSCGDNYGYRIPWGELMANGIWPWGDDLQRVMPNQQFVLLCDRAFVDYYCKVHPYLLQKSDAEKQSAIASGVNGSAGVLIVDNFFKQGVLDTYALIVAIKALATSVIAPRTPTEQETPSD